jgi:membrane associated rhomboid family serine protease
MARCAQCGQELPRFAFGDAATLCKDCLVRAAQDRAQAVAVSQPQPQSAPARSRPTLWAIATTFPVTATLLAINVVVYVAMLATGVTFTTNGPLIRWGADFGPLTLTTQPWRLLTSTFVHGGLLHVGFNMWCFWQLGMMCERIFRRWQYLVIYLMTGIAASMASVMMHPQIVSIGASGAIFGICGALIPALYFGRLPLPPAAVRATLRSLVIFVAVNLFFGLLPFIDEFAHLGGLLFGLLTGAALSRTLLLPAERRAQAQIPIFIALGLLLLAAWHFGQPIALARLNQMISGQHS